MTAARCDGSRYCEAETHLHGCFADRGKCDEPSEHRSAASVDPLDALEEKWRTEPADLAEWANRAMRTLALARKWRQSAQEWEASARKVGNQSA